MKPERDFMCLLLDPDGFSRFPLKLSARHIPPFHANEFSYLSPLLSIIKMQNEPTCGTVGSLRGQGSSFLTSLVSITVVIFLHDESLNFVIKLTRKYHSEVQRPSDDRYLCMSFSVRALGEKNCMHRSHVYHNIFYHCVDLL